MRNPDSLPNIPQLLEKCFENSVFSSYLQSVYLCLRAAVCAVVPLVIPLHKWRDLLGRVCPLSENRMHKSLFCEAQIRQQHLRDQTIETIPSICFFFRSVLNL